MSSVAQLPIIYVRGFAGGGSGIDTTTDDAFYGFNEGATHVRAGGNGEPQFYQFEGPLVRLIGDEGYKVIVHGNQQAFLQLAGDKSLAPNTVWVYRFYDAAASTFGRNHVQYDLPTAADELLDFLDLVRAKTGAAKVWLVAHSMGGLVCRSMIQRTCPERGRDARDVVDRFFTYATPHNGIEFSVGNVDIPVPQIAPVGAEIFNREVMYQYLTPQSSRLRKAPDEWDARVVDAQVFDPHRIFCLIGTNPEDYGPVSKVVGPKSDGLVQIDNAYVRTAPRAFVHRSHSGRYGVVNSEEGYQNLRRFLFGSRKVTVSLVNAELPPAVDKDREDVWQVESNVAIRGLPVLITDQVAASFCSIQLGTVSPASGRRRAKSSPVQDTPLATIFLLDPERLAQMQRDNHLPTTPRSPRARYSLAVRALRLQQRDGFLFFRDHLESNPEFSGHLVVDVGPWEDSPKDPQADHLFAAWESDFSHVTSATDPITNEPLMPVTNAGGVLTFEIPLPGADIGTTNVLGSTAAIRLVVEPWP